MQESKTFGSAIKKNEWTNKVNPLLACFFFEFASASFTYWPPITLSCLLKIWPDVTLLLLHSPSTDRRAIMWADKKCTRHLLGTLNQFRSTTVWYGPLPSSRGEVLVSHIKWMKMMMMEVLIHISKQPHWIPIKWKGKRQECGKEKLLLDL